MPNKTIALVSLSLLFCNCENPEDLEADGIELSEDEGFGPSEANKIDEITTPTPSPFEAAAWGPSAKYGAGLNPSIAVSGSKVVEIHKSNSYNTLWAEVGTISGVSISWAPTKNFGSGIQPSVALNSSGIVIEAHRSEFNANIWYSVSKVSGNGTTITWGSPIKLGPGKAPSIAMNNGGAVALVYETATQGDTTLYYKTGTTNGSIISWNPSFSYGHGTGPKVATSNYGLVAEAHITSGGTIECAAGSTTGNAILMGPTAPCGAGAPTSIAVNTAGKIVLAYESQKTLYTRTGTVSNLSINWEQAYKLDSGRTPAVGISVGDTRIVEVHNDPVSSDLRYRVGTAM